MRLKYDSQKVFRINIEITMKILIGVSVSIIIIKNEKSNIFIKNKVVIKFYEKIL